MGESERLTIRTAVFVLVLNDVGQILLQQRANTGFLDGYWDLPSGHVEPGEPIVESARRELEEEVRLQVSTENLKLVHINQNLLDIPYINFTFWGQKWQGEPKIGEPEKVSDVRFFDVNELPDKCSLGVRVMEQAGFATDLSYSFVDEHNFETVMHEPFDPASWGRK